MRAKLWTLVALVAVVGWQSGGCGPSLITIPVDVGLGSASTFSVQANTPEQKSFQTTFDTGGLQIGGGSIALDPDVITVNPTQSAKTASVLQDQLALEITVRVDDFDSVATVCDTGEQYGPFTVALDSNYVPVSVDPPTVTLSQATIDLLNSGQLSLCVDIVSPVDGTVIIGSLTFNVSL